DEERFGTCQTCDLRPGALIESGERAHTIVRARGRSARRRQLSPPLESHVESTVMRSLLLSLPLALSPQALAQSGVPATLPSATSAARAATVPGLERIAVVGAR